MIVLIRNDSVRVRAYTESQIVEKSGIAGAGIALPTQETTMQQERDGRNDFDFLVGRWKGYQRRLRERLVGSTEWEEFESRTVMHKILNGLGNFDEVTMYRDSGEMQGATLRLYNPDTHEWAIYWASSAGANNLFPPMIGKFEDGRGLFYAFEPFNGKHIYVRFIWTTQDNDHCRWEQAFSADGGQNWETNWTMDFVRES